MPYRSSSYSNLRMYFLIALICGLSALLMEFVSQGTRQFRSYAEQRLDSAVRQAVHSEVQELAIHSQGKSAFAKTKE